MDLKPENILLKSLERPVLKVAGRSIYKWSSLTKTIMKILALLNASTSRDVDRFEEHWCTWHQKSSIPTIRTTIASIFGRSERFFTVLIDNFPTPSHLISFRSECLFGRPPFTFVNTDELIDKIAFGPPIEVNWRKKGWWQWIVCCLDPEWSTDLCWMPKFIGRFIATRSEQTNQFRRFLRTSFHLRPHLFADPRSSSVDIDFLTLFERSIV